MKMSEAIKLGMDDNPDIVQARRVYAEKDERGNLCACAGTLALLGAGCVSRRTFELYVSGESRAFHPAAELARQQDQHGWPFAMVVGLNDVARLSLTEIIEDLKERGS